MIFYEAPHRLLDTLEELEKIFGSDREMAAIRELTKKFEEVRRGTVAEIKAHFTAQPPKGEFVLVFASYTLQQQRQAAQESWESVSIEEHMEHYLSQNYSEKDAMKQVAKDRGVSKREIYSYLHKD